MLHRNIYLQVFCKNVSSSQCKILLHCYVVKIIIWLKFQDDKHKHNLDNFNTILLADILDLGDILEGSLFRGRKVAKMRSETSFQGAGRSLEGPQWLVRGRMEDLNFRLKPFKSEQD